jgi:hypothetical protein
VGIVAVASVIVHYSDGKTVDDPLPPFSSDSHPSPINIYTVDQATVGRMSGVVLAGPISIIGACLGAFGLSSFHSDRRRRFIRLTGTAGALEIASTVMFISGGLAAAGLIDFIEDDVSFTPAVGLPAVAGAIMLVCAFLGRHPPESEGTVGKAVKGGKTTFKLKESGDAGDKVSFKAKGGTAEDIQDDETSDRPGAHSKSPEEPGPKRRVKVKIKR